MKDEEQKKRLLNAVGADGTTSLENAFEKILSALWSSSDKSSHRRYVWMAYTLALAAKPTVEAYLPNDSRSEQVLETTATWLKKDVTSKNYDSERSHYLYQR